MDNGELRFIQIEAKVNLIANAVIFAVAVLAGFAMYAISSLQAYEWALYYGIIAAVASGGMFQWEMRGLEKRLRERDERDE